MRREKRMKQSIEEVEARLYLHHNLVGYQVLDAPIVQLSYWSQYGEYVEHFV